MNIFQRLMILVSFVTLPFINGCTSSSDSEKFANNSYSAQNLITLEQSAMIARKYFATPNAIANERQKVIEGDDWLNAEYVNNFNSLPPDKQKLKRNDLIDELFILSDYNYYKYKINVSQVKRSINLGTEDRKSVV